MRTATDRKLLSGIRILTGAKNPKGIVLFSIMRNERFFIEAFLNYYRELGVDHFLILDDGSDDGTKEILTEQYDVTVLESEFAYGEVYRRVSLPFLRMQAMRAGIRLKALLPSAMLQDQWCVYADADEYSILPPEMHSFQQLVSELDRLSYRVVLGVVVEFYPKTYSDLKLDVQKAKSFDELLNIAPYFDSAKLLNANELGTIERLRPSASGRLFREYGVPLGSTSGSKKHRGSATHKLPLIKPGRRVKLLSGHKASVSASPDLALTVAHFKFTPDVLRRTNLALNTQAWSGGSHKYSKYELLFEKMAECNGTFISSDSVRYKSGEQLVQCGNLWWNL